MMRLWHKVRKVELKQHDASIVEIQRLPLVAIIPLLLFGGLLAFETARQELDPEYLPITAFVIVSGTGLLLLWSVLFAIHVEVDDREVVFGARPFLSRRIAIDQISHWQAATLQSQWRRSYFPTITKIYDRQPIDRHGVELTLVDGRHFFIGTAHPERLMHAIATAKFGATA
jgi:ABC-type nickel/cobalt efflux system permease component RcnA